MSLNAGEGRIRLVPDASGFRRKAEADLKKLDLTARVNLQPSNLAQASSDIARWKAQQERNGIKIPIQVDERSVDQVTRQVKKLKTDLGGSLGGALAWNAGALGLGSLPALSTALVNVAGAIQQVAQAGLVLPGVFAGGAASIGTFALGLSGMSDALEAVNKAADGTPESIEKANQAMAGLAPNARDVVKTLADLKPMFDGLKGTVQQNLFDGISENIKTLAANDLPVLQKGLGGIATAWNGTLKQLAASLGSDSSKGLLDRILGNTAEAQTRFNQAINPLVNGIGTLAAAGTGALPRIADGLTGVAKRFEAFITAADQDGRLDKWINDGITGVSHLGETLLNLGSAFTAITRAAGGGEGLLGTLEKGSKALSDFLNSAAGQQKLKDWFAEGREQLSQLWDILKEVPGALTGVYNAAKAWTDAFLPPLQKVTEFLGEHPTLIQNVVTAFLAWKSIQGVSSLLTSLTNVGTSLTGLPDKANTAAAGINKALALIVVPTIGKQLNDEIQQWLKDNAPGAYNANNSFTPDQLGRDLRTALDNGTQTNPNRAPAQGGLQGGIPQSQLQAPSGTRESGGAPPPSGGAGGLPGLPDNPVIPGRRSGGPTPTGGGRGPTGGFITELHPDEWVLPAHARKSIGDQALWAITRGRSFEGGGYIDQFGNPITPGPAPGGPAPLAPAPGGGGVQAAFGNFLSGLSGTIGNAAALGQGLAGQSIPGLQTQHGAGTQSAAPGFGDLAGRFAQVPGLIGLFGSLASNDPAAALTDWGGQTASWLGDFTAKTGGGFLSALWQGGLDAVGLGGSVLSPTNPWFQAISQTGSGAMDQNGFLGALFGADDSSLASSQIEEQQKQVSPKRLRDAQQKIDRADQRVAEIQQRIAELKPTASQSQRMSLQNDLSNAMQESQDARADAAALATGSSSSVFSSSAVPTSGSGGPEQWRPFVRQALATYGPQFGITNTRAWEDAMVRQIATESGGNPGADNPNDSNGRGGRQHVSGLLQFLPSTFAANNISGGDYLDPLAQIAAVIPYVANKYGMDASGAPRQIGRGVGYSGGGAARGPGGPTSDRIPAWLSNGEHVLSAADVAAMGGQANVYAFRDALHLAKGGQPIPPQPVVRAQPMLPRAQQMTPRAQQMAPRPAPAQVAPSDPAAQPPNTSAAPTPTSAPPQQRPASVAPVAAAPSSSSSDAYMHNISAIDRGIDSGAKALGQAAATAIGIAASLGAGAPVPGGSAIGALGGLGSYAAGLIQLGGGVVKNAVNVGSSLLVGSVPGTEIGSQDSLYGLANRPQQNLPVTAQDNRRSYVFNGIDGRGIVDDLRLMGQQEAQAQLAAY